MPVLCLSVRMRSDFRDIATHSRGTLSSNPSTLARLLQRSRIAMDSDLLRSHAREEQQCPGANIHFDSFFVDYETDVYRSNANSMDSSLSLGRARNDSTSNINDADHFDMRTSLEANNLKHPIHSGSFVLDNVYRVQHVLLCR